MLKKITFLACVIAVFVAINAEAIGNTTISGKTKFKDIDSNYAWAEEAINELSKKGIVNGVGDDMFMPDKIITKEQVAAMLSRICDLKYDGTAQTYSDVPTDRWSFNYVEAAKDIMIPSSDSKDGEFEPERSFLRSEIASSAICALGLSEIDLKNTNVLEENFLDSANVPMYLTTFCALAVENGILKGNESYIRPLDSVTRAEATVMLYRMSQIKDGVKLETDLKPAGESLQKEEIKAETPLCDKPMVTAKQAAEWAKSMEADQRYIDAAEIYWKYGEMTGINPEILYAQAAKETNYGKYTGNVQPEQNNWAGIKIKNPSGDKAEDHETFETTDDGIRAHFNHMCAYVGIEPVGTPHDRYYIVQSLPWAGTVKYVEELSGKWAPSQDYGTSLMSNYVIPMREFAKK